MNFPADVLVRKLTSENPEIKSSSVSLKSNSLSPYASQKVVAIIIMLTFYTITEGSSWPLLQLFCLLNQTFISLLRTCYY
jgi:hypothetical protein